MPIVAGRLVYPATWTLWPINRTRCLWHRHGVYGERAETPDRGVCDGCDKHHTPDTGMFVSSKPHPGQDFGLDRRSAACSVSGGTSAIGRRRTRPKKPLLAAIR